MKQAYLGTDSTNEKAPRIEANYAPPLNLLKELNGTL
jgi:hypothetical protein